MSEPTTYLRPEYRRTQAGHAAIDGVQFHSYQTGISRYARISDDGQILTRRNHEASTYYAAVIGHGHIKGPDGRRDKAFRSEEAAARAGVALWRKMQEQKA